MSFDQLKVVAILRKKYSNFFGNFADISIIYADVIIQWLTSQWILKIGMKSYSGATFSYKGLGFWKIHGVGNFTYTHPLHPHPPGIGLDSHDIMKFNFPKFLFRSLKKIFATFATFSSIKV